MKQEYNERKNSSKKMGSREKMKVWLEKTRVKDREYKKTGPYALGKLLFSPLKNKGGSDIYKNMRELQQDDLVLHLIIDEGFLGISKVKSSYSERDFDIGTGWDGPGYEVLLKDYVKIDNVLDKKDILSEGNRALLDEIRTGNKVFYDKNLDLNQGAYITEVPLALCHLIHETYHNLFNGDIPYLSEYVGQNPLDNPNSSPPEESETMAYSLNTILYGPPGTGKTYRTVLRATEIIEGRFISDYAEALKIFNANLHDKVEFITFHQNYSYEDFIQGLRPDTENGTELSFKKVDGVFKKISDRALENLNKTRKAENEPEEWKKEKRFEIALGEFIEEVQSYDDREYPITKSSFISNIEESAFRYNGGNWKSYKSGLLMKFSDLKEFYKNDLKERKDIKNLTNISISAKGDATYYYEVYKKILKHLPESIMVTEPVKENRYVIIIDEINRANISRVFGELITLIEPDKRSHGDIPLKAILPSGDEFVVPSNLYIIGTMNTADKSIALLDIALRRRFEFEAMYPLYEIEGKEIHDVEILKKLNAHIIKTKGYDFQIGHSYFMGENDDWNFNRQMNNKIIPLLMEYYMNDEKEVTGVLEAAGLKVMQKTWPLTIDETN